MLSRLLLKKPILTASLALTAQAILGQVQISGTVYDKSMLYGMRNVSVIGVSGAGTITDSVGNYHIKVPVDDSIYFSYLGRSTAKFHVKFIPPGYPYDMSLEVAVDSLQSVFVRSSTYRKNSLENRK